MNPLARLLRTAMDAVGRLITGGEAARPSPPTTPPEETYYYIPEEPEPLPAPSPTQAPPTIEITPSEPVESEPVYNNVEYVPEHYTGKNKVLSRYEVRDPEIGDIEDLLDSVPQGTYTIVIYGSAEIYKASGMGGDMYVSYVMNTEDLYDGIYDPATDQAQDAINYVLGESGDSWNDIYSIALIDRGIVQ